MYIPWVVIATLSGLRYSWCSSAQAISVLEKSTVTLPCDFSPSDEATSHVILWQKIDSSTTRMETIFNSLTGFADKYVNANLTVSEKDGNASIAFASISRYDEGIYKCQITSLPNFEQQSNIVKVEVLYPPEMISLMNTRTFVNVGDEVIILCAAEGSPNDIDYIWYKDGVKIGTDETRGWKTVYSKTDSTLTIKNVDSSKEGNYSCLSSNSIGTITSIHEIWLRKPFRFVRNPATDTNQYKYTVREGNNLTIVTYGDGVPRNISYSWSINNLSIEETNWIVKGPGQIEIENITRNDTVTISCSATNNVGRPDIINFQVEVQYPPFFTQQPEPYYSVAENESLFLPCLAKGLPRPLHHWVKVHSNESYTRHSSSSKVGGTWLFPNVSRHDAGIYMCIATNTIGISRVRTKIMTEYQPELTSIFHLEYTVLEGELFRLDCIADGSPEVKYQWFSSTHGSAQLTEGSDLNIETSKGHSSLLIGQVRREHYGVYRCQASNKRGMVFTETNLVVQYRPEIWKNSSDKLAPAIAGNPVVFHCYASGNPRPVIHWSSGNEDKFSKTSNLGWLTEGNFSTEYIDEETVKSTLRLGCPTKKEHSKGYKCTAENAYGVATEIFESTILEPPAPPTQLYVSRSWEDGAIIKWSYQHPDAMSDRYASTTFYVIVKKVPGGKPWRQKCWNQNSCLVNNLQLGSSYIITVFAENSAGKGIRSSPILLVMPVTSEEKTTTVSPTVAISQEVSTGETSKEWRHSITISNDGNRVFWRIIPGYVKTKKPCIILEIKNETHRWQKLTPCLLANSGEVQTHNTASNILVRFASCRKGYCSVLGRVTRWDKDNDYHRTYQSFFAIGIAATCIIVAAVVACRCHQSNSRSRKSTDAAEE